jgi:methanogenic corrinoid protein MtbC1
LRAWERRYGLTAPARTAAGYRLYSDDDVAVLRGAKALVDGGQSISDVARRPRDELRRAGAQAPVSALVGPGMADGFVAAAVAAVRELDGTRLENLILHATAMGTLSSLDTCDRVLLPLLVAIGSQWEKRELSIAAEHFGTAIVRRHLHTLVQSETRGNADAPAIVCACPEGDQHEGGLLAFALHAAVSGWNVLYLGPNVPVADVVAAAAERRAGAIALSLSRPPPPRSRRRLLQALAAWRGESAERRVWLGGRGASQHAAYYRAAGFALIDRAEAFAVAPASA